MASSVKVFFKSYIILSCCTCLLAIGCSSIKKDGHEKDLQFKKSGNSLVSMDNKKPESNSESVGVSSFLVSVSVEQALVSGRWEEVARKLEQVSDGTLDAPAKFVKAHALLRTNLNNEAMWLFVRSNSLQDLIAWDKWTLEFVNKYDSNVIAHYLRGDALARRSKSGEAFKEFNRAIKIQPDDAMVLNARGTFLATTGQWDQALVDIFSATQSDNTFADAHASLGATWVFLQDSPKESYQSFQKALDLSADFALAINGQACANLAEGLFDEAITKLERANQIADWIPLPVNNMIIVASMRKELIQSLTDGKNVLQPGTPIQAISNYVDSLTSEQSRETKAIVDRNHQRNGDLERIGKFLSSYNPVSIRLDRKFNNSNEDGTEWNKIIQIAYKMLEELKARFAQECSGKATSDACKELQRQINEFEDAIKGIGKSDGNKKKMFTSNETRRKLETVLNKQGIKIKIIPIPTPISDGSLIWGSSLQNPTIDIQSLGKRTIQFSRLGYEFWLNFQKTLAERLALKPGGVSAVGTMRTHWDKGVGLSITYGLLYPFPKTSLNSNKEIQ